MRPEDFIEPKDVSVKDGQGGSRTFRIAKFDCIFGREVYSQYPVTALPKVGDYRMNEELMFRALKYVAVEVTSGVWVTLETQDLIRNHVKDWEQLTGIERELGAYNFSFFQNGKAFGFFDGLAKIFLQKITETLTTSSARWSAMQEKAAPPSSNSVENTP